MLCCFCAQLLLPFLSLVILCVKYLKYIEHKYTIHSWETRTYKIMQTFVEKLYHIVWTTTVMNIFAGVVRLFNWIIYSEVIKTIWSCVQWHQCFTKAVCFPHFSDDDSSFYDKYVDNRDHPDQLPPSASDISMGQPPRKRFQRVGLFSDFYKDEEWVF